MATVSKVFSKVKMVEPIKVPPVKACRPVQNPYKEPERRKHAIQVIVGGTLTFAGICLYRGDEKFYKQFVTPAMRMIDAEQAHRFAVRCAAFGLLPRPKMRPDPPSMAIEASQKFPQNFRSCSEEVT
ncbi:unnamed protein product, partial [Notodromas monacha]